MMILKNLKFGIINLFKIKCKIKFFNQIGKWNKIQISSIKNLNIKINGSNDKIKLKKELKN